MKNLQNQAVLLAKVGLVLRLLVKVGRVESKVKVLKVHRVQVAHLVVQENQEVVREVRRVRHKMKINISFLKRRF